MRPRFHQQNESSTGPAIFILIGASIPPEPAKILLGHLRSQSAESAEAGGAAGTVTVAAEATSEAAAAAAAAPAAASTTLGEFLGPSGDEFAGGWIRLRNMRLVPINVPGAPSHLGHISRLFISALCTCRACRRFAHRDLISW